MFQIHSVFQVLFLLPAMALAPFAHAVSLDDMQGHWSRYGVRCAGTTELYDVPPGVTLDFADHQMTSQSLYRDGPHYAQTVGTISAQEVNDVLEITFDKVSRVPYINGQTEFYDFLDNKTSMNLTLRLSDEDGTQSLILGGDTDDGTANGCAADIEFLYKR